MLDSEPTGAGPTDATTTTATPDGSHAEAAATTAPRRRRGASRPAGPPSPELAQEPEPAGEVSATPAKKATRKRATKKSAAPDAAGPVVAEPVTPEPMPAEAMPAETAAKATRKRTRKSTSPASAEPADATGGDAALTPDEAAAQAGPAAIGLLFQPPEPAAAPARRRAAAKAAPPEQQDKADDAPEGDVSVAGGRSGDPDGADSGAEEPSAGDGEEATSRRRRRGGRGRRGRGRDTEETGEDGVESVARAEAVAAAESDDTGEGGEGDEDGDTVEGETGTSRRRRRRRRRGGGDDPAEVTGDDPPNTVVRVREPRKTARGRGEKTERDDDSGVRAIKGSTRLEAKKQRRREGRDAGRRRPSVITEAEFLARRESVDRVMIVRQVGDRTQIAVLEDGVLVEHYVSTASSAGLLGNVYLGRVQNVLPSMEAAFVDIGKGRNAVLYAGEVNWDAAGLDGQPRRIELAMKSGDPVLVQVTKDPIGHKGARLTSQVSLAGRYLVLVPGGSMTGISRKLPDTERSRLKAILRQVVPEGSGVIVRTAAEGASEEELARDVARLTAQWADIEKKADKGSAAAALLYGEPDMTIRVVRDIFNEDFASLVVAGDDAWDMLDAYVGHVAPDLRDRMSRWTAEQDVFTEHRVDEQLAKALDRKVWLPSGGYLIIDRTEAMIVVDVNTGKFTGAGGNLEETVTENNLEAAEELVRQLRLRDLGGMIVIDFIDMVLESNRDLVLRRLLECLGRDRTKHQVAEVTSLGLVQMTRKRVGQGLHEVFAETCETCSGRGYHIHTEPVDKAAGGGNGSGGGAASERKGGARGGRARGGAAAVPSPAPASDPKPIAPAPVETAAPVETPAPVAMEDPVEPSAPVQPVEPVAAAPRRRRKAVSPVTTL